MTAIVCAPLRFRPFVRFADSDQYVTVIWGGFLSLFLPSQNLAAQKTYSNLGMSMKEALRRRRCFIEGVIKCYPDETLETAVDRIADAEVGRCCWLMPERTEQLHIGFGLGSFFPPLVTLFNILIFTCPHF